MESKTIKLITLLVLVFLLSALISNRQVSATGEMACAPVNDGSGDEICSITNGYYINNDYINPDLGFSRIGTHIDSVRNYSNYGGFGDNNALTIQPKESEGGALCSGNGPPDYRNEFWGKFTLQKNGQQIFEQALGSNYANLTVKSIIFDYDISIASRTLGFTWSDGTCKNRSSVGAVWNEFSQRIWDKTGVDHRPNQEVPLNWNLPTSGNHSLNFFSAVTTNNEHITWGNIRFKIHRPNVPGPTNTPIPTSIPTPTPSTCPAPHTVENLQIVCPVCNL